MVDQRDLRVPQNKCLNHSSEFTCSFVKTSSVIIITVHDLNHRNRINDTDTVRVVVFSVCTVRSVGAAPLDASPPRGGPLECPSLAHSAGCRTATRTRRLHTCELQRGARATSVCCMWLLGSERRAAERREAFSSDSKPRGGFCLVQLGGVDKRRML